VHVWQPEGHQGEEKGGESVLYRLQRLAAILDPVPGDAAQRAIWAFRQRRPEHEAVPGDLDHLLWAES
jgi:hypothetical protein